jgi:type VII secretion protein EccB
MATRKDQLQSHQFLGQRMVSALVTRDSDPEQPPFRRPLNAAIGSFVIAFLALAVVAVYGLVVPGGNKAWQSGELVIVEKETGTRYVYLDGRLHPVTNYVSALLALGKNSATKQVSRKSLSETARGPRIGIPDAPDALAPASRLLAGGWTLCSQPIRTPAGEADSESVLLVGSRPDTAQPLGTKALLVEVIETGDRYLISDGLRHRIDKSDAVAVGLALRTEPWARVGSAFVAALPEGRPIAPIKPAGIGTPSTAIPDRPATKVGQLFVVKTSGGGRQYYLAAKTRPVPISELQYDIQTAYRPLAAAYGGKAPVAIELGLLSVGRSDPLPDSTGDSSVPRSRPEFAAPNGGNGTVCATFAPGSTRPVVAIEAVLPARDPMMITPKRGPRGTALADRIVVPPGTAAVVEAMPSGRAPAGTVALVTDLGRAYPLADPKLLDTLGYAGTRPVRLPADLVARIPQGPGLSPASAMTAAP